MCSSCSGVYSQYQVISSAKKAMFLPISMSTSSITQKINASCVFWYRMQDTTSRTNLVGDSETDLHWNLSGFALDLYKTI